MESVLGLVRHPGNDALFRALEMSLLATLAGQPLHIHAEGLRGTGKTTMMRAVRRILPRIRRIRGCLYNCDPAAPHCPVHRGLGPGLVADLGEEWVPMPFLEISHSAKIGTVVGSIDLGRLVSPTQPEAALLPGTIPQAHRGIIFVDEVNRLAETSPELADVLLDVMGTRPGRVQIEETGLPAVELPISVSVWAASNPDEDPGPLEEIRRQLSDRFDFAVYTDRPGDSAVVEQILSMTEGTGQRPSAVVETDAELWRTRLGMRAAELRRVDVPSPLRQQVAGLYSRFELESLRAVQAIQSGIRLSACMENRTEAMTEDLHRVAPMALRHRVDSETVRKITAFLVNGDKAEPAIPANRSRFPGISFGGLVAETAPPRTVPPLGSGSPQEPAGREPQAAGQSPAGIQQPNRTQTDWPTQYPPQQRPAQPRPAGSPDGDSWLRRTLSQWGIGRPGEQAGPQQRKSAGLDRPGGGQGLDRPSGGAPWDPRPETGRNRSGSQPGQSQSLTHSQKGQGSRGTPGSGGSGHLPNPAEHPPEAPPNRARPLSQLRPEEWVRTEEELRRL